jgi:Tfp pilus assembly protein PilV
MSNYSDRRQRGTALIEALLGVFIMTVIGAGTAQIAARIAVGQREMRAEGIALAQMRELLVRQGTNLCDSTTEQVVLPGGQAVSVEDVVCDTDPPVLRVEPDVNDPAVAPWVEVNAVKPVKLRVQLSNLAIDAGDGETEIEVGTRS